MNYINIKNLAMVFLFLVLICCLGVAMYDLIVDIAIPEVVGLILGSGIGYCLTILGLNHGIDTINGTIQKTVSGALSANAIIAKPINQEDSSKLREPA